jgi:hypothetical protein
MKPQKISPPGSHRGRNIVTMVLILLLFAANIARLALRFSHDRSQAPGASAEEMYRRQHPFSTDPFLHDFDRKASNRELSPVDVAPTPPAPPSTQP